MSKKEEKETKQNSKEEEINEENIEKEKLKQEEINDKDKEEKPEEIIFSLKKEKLLLLAELDNKQKDFQRQLEQIYKYSNKKIVLWVLDFLIDLEERALRSMRDDSEKKVKNHLLGIEMMRDNLWKKLENEGVKEMEIKVGKDMWSSYFHELVEEVVEDKLPEGTVAELSEKGYLLHGKVLRPAKVKISKKINKQN